MISTEQSGLSLEPHWVEWLGTIQRDAFNESTLYITAIQDSRHDTMSDPLPVYLRRRVRFLHAAFALLGCGYNTQVLMVGGESDADGNLRIGPIEFGSTPYRRPYYRTSRKIQREDISEAAKILVNLELIYSHAPDPLFRRLRKGFNIWNRAALEGEDWTERLHAFVRCTEAVLKTTIARPRAKAAIKRSKRFRNKWRDITGTFVERGQALIGRSVGNAKLLREFYDIRSRIEHVKDIMPAVKKAKGIDRRETFEFRALQCEILASAIYSRILNNCDLTDAFSTESRIESFWAQSGQRRQSRWGNPINLDEQSRMQFISHADQSSY